MWAIKEWADFLFSVALLATAMAMGVVRAELWRLAERLEKFTKEIQGLKWTLEEREERDNGGSNG